MKDETEKKFISRCVRELHKLDPERDQKQIIAICYSQFRREAMHTDFQRILSLFQSRYGDDEGLAKFTQFVELNNLNPELQYHTAIQFQESFQWVEPLITRYKADTHAKYYKVRCITANISMNNNDYRDYKAMQRADISMNWRPVNMNHDHTRWLPFPRTRMDWALADDLSIEATLRVDNADAWLQQMLDNGEVIQPSIEGRRIPEAMGGGYHFIGLALLEKGRELPGDPLTEITPLILNESVGAQVCKIINGQIVCGTDGIYHESTQEKPVEVKNMSKTEPEVTTETPDENTNKELRLSEENLRLQGENTELRQEKIELTGGLAKKEDEIATLKREIINLEEQIKRIAELENDVDQCGEKYEALDAKYKSALTEKGEIAKRVSELENTLHDKEKVVEDHQTQIDKLTYLSENLRKDVMQLTEKATDAHDKARISMKDRSEMQIENANLTDECARVTRKNAELAEKRADDAKRLYKTETENEKLREIILRHTQTESEMMKSMKSLQKKANDAWKILNERKIYQVDDDGKLIVGS